MDLHGSIPGFIRITHGKIHDVTVPTISFSSPILYILDRGLYRLPTLYRFTRAWLFYYPRQSNLDYRRITYRPSKNRRDSAAIKRFDFKGPKLPKSNPETLRRISYFDVDTQKACVLSKQLQPASLVIGPALQMPLAGGTLFQMDQAAPSNQAFYGTPRTP